jgi:plasmid stability protein
MKNITVSVDEETYRRARVRAAERDTSVSAMVRAFLCQLGQDETEAECLKREEVTLRERVVRFSATSRLSREEAHERK